VDFPRALRPSWLDEAQCARVLETLAANGTVLMAHAAGVQVLAGTDSNDTMIFPGFALHDELERFREAGMSPMDVLATATSSSAVHLGRPELGTVSVGAMADLVILNQDPLADIANTRSIELVIVGG